jgi:hypothetical protein
MKTKVNPDYQRNGAKIASNITLFCEVNDLAIEGYLFVEENHTQGIEGINGFRPYVSTSKELKFCRPP